MLGVEFILAGLSKLMDANLVAHFQNFVAAQPGSSSGLISPILQLLVLPNAALAARSTAFVELSAGCVLLLSALHAGRRHFSGRARYEPALALAASTAALTVACLALMIYLLQGGGLPFVNATAAFESPIAIELFLVPLALSAAWVEFSRFMAPRRWTTISSMVTQVRFYTVKDGMMDSWVNHFNEKIVPTSAKYGVHVQAAWANRAQNEFIWVRSFESEDALKKYEASPERAAYLATNREHLAKTEFRDVESVLRTPAAAA
jgi:hypothetical protein